MKIIDQQNRVLNDLVNIIYNQTDEGYETALCKYTFLEKFKSTSINFSFYVHGEQVKKAMTAEATIKSSDLVEELRALMKEHTGGEWRSFTLTLDADGKATTKFTYPES